MAELRYKPWGETRYGEPNDTPTTYRFTGQRQELELGGEEGLYYYGARWYDPYLNRWLQPDQIVPEPGDPQSLNRFSYAINNPLKYVDPSGHDWIDALAQFVGGVAFQWAVTNREAVISSSPEQRQAIEALAPDTDAFVAGRVVGAVAASAQGVVEFSAGTGGIGGGVAICGTGVLCPAGVGAVAGGTIVAAHGASVAVRGASDAGQQLGIVFAAKTPQQIQKAIRSHQGQIVGHQRKLEQYMRDPDSMDNLGLLKNAPDALRQKIIQARIQKLLDTIQKHQNEIDKLLNQLNQLKPPNK